LKCNYYNWNDQNYRQFMTFLLSKLEPRKEEADTIIFRELDDFPEILFFHSGHLDIGFEINKRKYFVLRKRKSITVGDHGCTFKHRCMYIYRTHTVCEGFSIRRQAWSVLLSQQDQEIVSQLKQRISS
jgi:hypothetical protein